MFRRRKLPLHVEPLEPRWLLSATVFEHGNIGYFVHSNTTQLERYDIANETWLSSVTLTGASGAPTVAHVDADGIYAAFGNSIYRYNLDGSGRTHLLNLLDNVSAIHSDGNLLFLNHTSGLYARFVSIDKATNTIIDTIENYVDSVAGSSISAETNRIIGRSQGISPSDITYVAYDNAGMFTGGGDSPYHGDYPGGSRTWVFPGGMKVVDNSGTIYATDSLTRLNSFGRSITSLDFFGADIPIVLNGKTLSAYTSTILPTGSVTLSYTPSDIFVNDRDVITFTPDAASATGFRADIVALTGLNPPTPGQPVNPIGLAYTPDKIELAAGGTVLLFSKTHQSIFRWNPATQTYGATIPLVGTPNFMAYSAVTNTAYLAYASGLIRKIDLNAANPVEVPFATLPDAPLGLATAGSYLFAVDPSGAWVSHYTFAPNGTQIDAVEWNYYSTEYVWSEANQKMYFFRDDTSPNDLLWEEINANGTAYPGEVAGGIRAKLDSPLHSSTGFSHPIRVAPDGSIVVLGSGAIHNATTLARQTLALANPIKDAAWLGGQLFTIRTIAGTAQFQRWTTSTYGQDKVLQFSGTAHALMTISADRMLGASLDGNGIPVFTVLDQNLATVPVERQLSLELSAAAVAENQAPGTTVGAFSTTDNANGHTFTYAFGAGDGDADNAAFTIAGAALKTASTFDFETKSSYSIRVRSTDEGGIFTERTFVINITNANDAPKFTVGASQAVTDKSGLQDIANWATDISPGPADESGQTLEFIAAADRPELFVTQPQIDSTGRLTFTSAMNAHGTAVVTVVLKDNGGTANGGLDQSSSQSFTIQINKLNPWTNSVAAMDVTNDQYVVADDALAVINFLNAFGSHELTNEETAQAPYCDVDSDGWLTANDALDVIDWLNAFGGGEVENSPLNGEGEGEDTISLLAGDWAETATRRRRLR